MRAVAAPAADVAPIDAATAVADASSTTAIAPTVRRTMATPLCVVPARRPFGAQRYLSPSPEQTIRCRDARSVRPARAVTPTIHRSDALPERPLGYALARSAAVGSARSPSRRGDAERRRPSEV